MTLVTGALVERLLLAPDGRRIEGVEYRQHGERRMLRAGTVILSAGAVNSAALLLRSTVANRSGVVGRYFMNHNCTAMLAVDPRVANNSVYQKTLGINDFYFDDGRGGAPLGNVQLLGKITGPILRANARWAPGFALSWLARHSVDWYLMSEDLPDPESRVRVDGDTIVLDWRRSNMTAHNRLVARMRELFRAAGYPIVLARPFDRRTPSHQCGTVRFGTDPATSALDPFCRAHDHPNLFVVDASFLPTSAAVNPALTIAAQALRVADHLAAAPGDPPTSRRPMPERPVALVTGARRGIGRAIAEALASAGFDLAITDIAEEADEALAALRANGAEAAFFRSDLAELSGHAATVAQVVDRFGRIDCLVNNAGMGAVARGDLLDLLPENFDRVIGVNLRGTIFLTQAVARWMLAHPAPDLPRSIVHVTSVSAALASPERLDYCISKAGLAMWSKGLALRLAPEGIAVFDVRPGIIRTDMTAGVAEPTIARLPTAWCRPGAGANGRTSPGWWRPSPAASSASPPAA